MRNIKLNFRGLTLPILGPLLLVAGCDTTKTNNNRSDFPVPQIGVNNSIANVRIGEKVGGASCVTEVLGVLSFPLTKKSTAAVTEEGLSSAEREAKEGAVFNALFEQGPDKGFNDDIIVNPLFAMKVSNYGIYRNICATVIGYRGSVTGFKESPTITGLPDPNVATTKITKSGLFGKDSTTIESSKPDQNIQINVQ